MTLESLAWLIVLISAIWTGMFTRYVGQFVIDWSRKPADDLAAAKARRAALAAIASTVGNSWEYCRQMGVYLAGLPYTAGESDQRLQDAAKVAGRMQVVPTFNLDVGILESSVSSVFSLLNDEQAKQVMTTRLEIRHVHRRVDTIAEMIFLRSDKGQPNQLQSQYIEGTRSLIETTEGHCEGTKAMLDQEVERLSTEPARNWRPLIVVAVILIALIGFVWATSVVESISIDVKGKRASVEMAADPKLKQDDSVPGDAIRDENQ